MDVPLPIQQFSRDDSMTQKGTEVLKLSHHLSGISIISSGTELLSQVQWNSKM
jgi:hypothetical protein